MKLAKIALTTNPEEDLLGRKHKPRVSCPSLKAGTIAWRNALNRASLDVYQVSGNSKRAWTYDFALSLTVAELEAIRWLKEILSAHRLQMSPQPVARHKSRQKFGKYLKETFGLVSCERHQVYHLTASGTTTADAVSQMLRERNDKTAPPGMVWVALCCHRHYARGSHALNSIRAQECGSWVEAQAYADSFNGGKNGWTKVELREIGGVCCSTCGTPVPQGGSSLCIVCWDAWPRVSRQEMRELEEIVAEEEFLGDF